MQFFTRSFMIIVAFANLILPTLQWKSHEFNHGLADFTDMGSYTHGIQANIMEEVEGLTTDDKSGLKTRSCNCATGMVPIGEKSGINTDIQALHFLKRVVSSLLHQMNVRGHTFGPQEAITIDLQAEILYEDFITLNDFLKSKSEDSGKYLHRVDDIFSSLLHLSEASLACSVFETVQEGVINFLKIVASVRTLFITLVSAIFVLIVAILTWKLWKSSSLISILKYGFVVVVVVGFAWEFYAHIEKAQAKNAARLVQTPEMPRECNYDDLTAFETVYYFGRHVFSNSEDRCVQYFTENSVDPIWGISPAAALAETFGNLSASFTNAFTTVFPYWLRPIITLLLTVLVLFFSFMGIFGFKIRTPLVSIEPAGRGHQANYGAAERRLSNSPLPELEQAGASQKQVAEKSASEVVRVKTRDASVDTCDFEEYLLNLQQQENEENRRQIPEIAESASTNLFWTWLQGSSMLARFLRRTFSTFMKILDTLLRRTPSMMISRHVNHRMDEVW